MVLVSVSLARVFAIRNPYCESTLTSATRRTASAIIHKFLPRYSKPPTESTIFITHGPKVEGFLPMALSTAARIIWGVIMSENAVIAAISILTTNKPLLPFKKRQISENFLTSGSFFCISVSSYI